MNVSFTFFLPPISYLFLFLIGIFKFLKKSYHSTFISWHAYKNRVLHYFLSFLNWSKKKKKIEHFKFFSSPSGKWEAKYGRAQRGFRCCHCRFQFILVPFLSFCVSYQRILSCKILYYLKMSHSVIVDFCLCNIWQ